MSQDADLELVGTEQVRVVGGGEVGGQFGDLGVDGLADGLRELLDLGSLRVWQGCARHWVDSSSSDGISTAVTDLALVYKNSTNFQDAHRGQGTDSEFVVAEEMGIVHGG